MKRLLLIPLLALLLANGREPAAPANETDPPPTAAAPPTAQPTPTQSDGPFPIVGDLWADTSDAGHCPGYVPYNGGGAAPALSWPVPGGVLNEARGYRVGHPAVDIAAPFGSPVTAAASGVVVWSGWTSFGLGQAVALSHGAGWVTVYGHLSAVAVDCGQWVGRGAAVGSVGRSGASNYDHLHFVLMSGGLAYRPSLLDISSQ